MRWWRRRCCRQRRETLEATAATKGAPPAAPAPPQMTDVAARVEAGLPSYTQATLESQQAQVSYKNAYNTGKPPDAAFYVLLAAKARTMSVTSVLFAAIFARKASAKSSDKAWAAALQVRRHYDSAVAAEQATKNAANNTTAARTAAAMTDQARVRCQAGLLDVMAVVERPQSTPPRLPPRIVPVEDCDNYDSQAGGPLSDESRAASPEEKRLIAYLQAKGRELLAHLLAKDPSTLTLNLYWTRRVLPMLPTATRRCRRSCRGSRAARPRA